MEIIKHLTTQQKEDLTQELQSRKYDFCKIGITKTKNLLNNLIRKSNKDALILRRLLEAETMILYTLEKEHNFEYNRADFNKSISQLISIFNSDSSLSYGFVQDANDETLSKLVFQLRFGEQIYFYMGNTTLPNVPNFNGELNCDNETMLSKIEDCIMTYCGNEITEFVSHSEDRKHMYQVKEETKLLASEIIAKVLNKH